MEEKPLKEQRIRQLTSFYYSRPEVQNAIFEFSKNREVSPRFMESFGKRPDSFQYKNDIFELVKKGATSFHCSVELWGDPLKLSTNQTKEELNQLRTGWDLLIDIDCKYFDFSKKAAIAVISVLREYGVKNAGVKFSGSKGFHIIIPWNSFPEIVSGEKAKNLFPELPRKVIQFLSFQARKKMSTMLDDDFYDQFKNTKIRKGIKCSICDRIAREYYDVLFLCENCKRKEDKKVNSASEVKPVKCPDCRGLLEPVEQKLVYECDKCKTSSIKSPNSFSKHIEIDLFELMGLDMILISPRHLFRMPYSLHEKTSLSSAVLTFDELENFHPRDADPLKIKIRDFIPNSKDGEATELVLQALDWFKESNPEKENFMPSKHGDFKPVKIEKISENIFPPSIQQILKGVSDGRKRALFILINLFRSIGMEKDQIEKEINFWNKKNTSPLEDGYIRAQVLWSYRNKIVPPPNFDKDYYKGIGVIPNTEEMRYKNPVNYIVKKYSSNPGKPRNRNKDSEFYEVKGKGNFKK